MREGTLVEKVAVEQLAFQVEVLECMAAHLAGLVLTDRRVVEPAR
jgi:hypothetical protein